MPGSEVWVSDPTWDNHRSMFEGAGLAVHTYPYYDAGHRRARRSTRCATTLRGVPRRSVVLLHACCHNPTGVDLTRAQWDALIPLLRERELLPYLDLAYQGFGDGIDDDAYAVRALARRAARRPAARFFVANSFSKSMSLYGERCGALSVVCPDAAEAENVLGQLKFTVRRNYSSPPIHGGQIVAAVLGEPGAARRWEGRARGDARAHPGDAQRAARRAARRSAGPRLRLLPEPARHVQLHRPDAGAGRPPARGARGLPGPLGADVRGGPEPQQRRGDRAGDGAVLDG